MECGKLHCHPHLTYICHFGFNCCESSMVFNSAVSVFNLKGVNLKVVHETRFWQDRLS